MKNICIWSNDSALVCAYDMHSFDATGHLIDVSGNGHTGTLTSGAVSGANGKYGSGIKLLDQAPAQWISLANGPFSNGATAITCMAWVYVLPGAVNSTQNIEAIWNLNGSGTDAQGSFRFHYAAAPATGLPPDGLQFLITLGGTLQIAVVSYNFGVNQWYHIAAVWTGTTVTFYVNGNNIGVSTITGGLIATGNAAPSLGGQSTTSILTGTLGEAMLFNRALSSQEIAYIASSPFSIAGYLRNTTGI